MMEGRAMISCCGTSFDLQLKREAKEKAEAKERRRYFMLVDQAEEKTEAEIFAKASASEEG